MCMERKKDVLMNERVLWVDYAKAIGIILVVYGHVARGLDKAGLHVTSSWFHFADSVVYSFHMPLFFFLSGLFFVDSLNKLNKAGLITSKLKTVLYPYVVWSLLQGLSEVVLSNYTNGNVSISQVLSLFWAPRAQFWFLYALFFIFLVCSFVYSLTSRKSFFAFLYLIKKDLVFISITNMLLANTVFFALGIWFNEIKTYFEANHKCLAFLFGILFIVSQYIFHITLGYNYTIGGFPVLALAIISIFFVTSVSIWLSEMRIRWFAYLGASSMTIYLMHILAGSGIRIVLSKFIGVESVGVHIIFGVLAGITLPLLMQVIIKRKKLNFLFAFPSVRNSSYKN